MLISLNRFGEEAFFQVLFNDDIWKEFKKYMYPNKKVSNFYDYRDGNLAAKYGYLSLIKESANLFFSDAAIDYAAEEGHLDVVQYLHYNRLDGCTEDAMDEAAANGHLDIVEFLHYNRGEGCTEGAMNEAACFGHFEIVKFLHYNRTEGCTMYAMNKAISGGHLDIVKFLHYNRKERFTYDAINEACIYGHLDVVKFLYENSIHLNNTYPSTIKIAENGHIDIIKLLSKLERISDIHGTMISSIKHGHLDIVIFLYEEYGEDYFVMEEALIVAVHHKHLHIVEYFYNNTEVDNIDEALNHAILVGSKDIADFLTYYIKEDNSTYDLVMNTSKRCEEIVNLFK